MWLFCVFIRASNAEGCKWPGYHCSDVMKVGEVEYRRWEGARGCLKMAGTFTNSKMLQISVGMQPYITSRWWWQADSFLDDFMLTGAGCCKWHFTKFHRFDWKTSHCPSSFTALSGGHWCEWVWNPGSELWNMSFKNFKEALITH